MSRPHVALAELSRSVEFLRIYPIQKYTTPQTLAAISVTLQAQLPKLTIGRMSEETAHGIANQSSETQARHVVYCGGAEPIQAENTSSMG